MRRLAIPLVVWFAAFAVAERGGPKNRPVVDWQVAITGKTVSPAVRSGDAILYVTDGKRLVCRAIEDGEKRWERNVSNRARPVVHAGKVWVGMEPFTLERGDPAPIAGVEGRFDAAPSFTKDLCVAVSVEGKLYCVDLVSGKLVRVVEVGPVRVGTALVGARAYVVNDRGELRAIAARKGRQIWKIELGEPARARLVQVGQHLFVVLQDAIAVIDTKDGTQLVRISARDIATPLGASKGLLFYGTSDGVVVRINAETRREVGRISVSRDSVAGHLTTGGGVIYGVAGKRLFAVHARTGSRVWTYDGKAEFSSPFASDGALFLAAGNVFYCLR